MLYDDVQESSVETCRFDDSIDGFTSETNTNEKGRTIAMNLMTILTATTLNLLGFTLTSPLNPTIGKHFNLSTGASFGSLTSAYPAGMLIGLFIWPKLSDLIGRKKILIISLFGSGMGLFFQSILVYRQYTLSAFLATRIFTGFFSGTAPVTKAFLADLGDQGRDKGLVSKYLGWRDAASTLSYILGPAMGGILYDLLRTEVLNGQGSALSFVIGVSAMGSIIASLLILVLVTDLSKTDRHDDSTQKKINVKEDGKNEVVKEEGIKEIEEFEKIEKFVNDEFDIVACPLGSSLWSGVATVCAISFLYHVADSTFFAFYPALLKEQLKMNTKAIGMSFTGFACVSFLFSATSISSKMIEKAGVVNTCVLGLGAISVGLSTLSISSSAIARLGITKFLTLGAPVLYFMGIPMYGPTIPLMLLQCVPPCQRGAIMGIDGAINTMARIISPLIMGDIYRRFGATCTFGIASGAACLSASLASLRRMLVKRKQRKLI